MGPVPYLGAVLGHREAHGVIYVSTYAYDNTPHKVEHAMSTTKYWRIRRIRLYSGDEVGLKPTPNPSPF